MAESSQPDPKRRKGEEVDEDRISNLPDSILSHILSFLPTQQVVATSILSRRWRSLSTSLSIIDLVERRYPVHPQRRTQKLPLMSFSEIVYRVLAAHKAPHLEKFRIECPDDVSWSDFDTWVYTATGSGVKELDLCFMRCDLMFGRRVTPFETCDFRYLPLRVFTCKSLVVLKLNRLSIDVPDSAYLPNLKILHLNTVVCEDENSVKRLFSGCPVLEDLHVEGLIAEVIFTFSICLPTLKKLYLNLDDDEVSVNVLEIDAPSLEFMCLYVNESHSFFAKNLSGLVEARLYAHNTGFDCDDDECDGEYCHLIAKFVEALLNVRTLTLYGALQNHCVQCTSVFNLPMFPNLTLLNLHIKCNNWQKLMRIIDSCHKLKVIKVIKYKDWRSPECCWMEPECVPKCLSLYLIRFYFEGFKGSAHDLKLFEFILKNSRVLKRMEIDTLYLTSNKKIRFLEQISKFPIVSRGCKLSFVVNTS